MKHYAQNIQSNYTLIKWGVNEMERFIGTIAISALFIFIAYVISIAMVISKTIFMKDGDGRQFIATVYIICSSIAVAIIDGMLVYAIMVIVNNV